MANRICSKSTIKGFIDMNQEDIVEILKSTLKKEIDTYGIFICNNIVIIFYILCSTKKIQNKRR